MERSTRRGARRRPIAAGAVGVLWVLAGCAPGPTDTFTAARVLQSITVEADADGSVRSIDGIAVAVGADAAQTATTAVSYDAAEVAGDLPVRITTAYRTADAGGTDLAELAGHSGRVEIELAVENLTVHAESLDLDVAGRAATRPALVGAPLTLAASAVLRGVSPSDVVTSTDAGEPTNGVLSRDDSGDAIVQWASLLAPPSGGATATLRLVADVSDFAVPVFEVAVQPGLSADPTLRGTFDSAFDPGPTTRLALERRTIELVTAVDELLTRAGTTVAEVRTSLDATAETLGVRTAHELRTSAASTAASMQGLSAQLAALRSELSATVSGTRSALLQQLSLAIDAVDTMLGDTATAPTAPDVSGSGCSVVVQTPGGGASIHSELLRLTAELDHYGAAADSCRAEVVASLRSAVGPEAPSAESCVTPSLTCSLAESGAAADAVLLSLLGEGRALVDSLQPELMAGVGSGYDLLSTRVDELVGAAEALDSATPDGSVAAGLAAVVSALDRLDSGVDDLDGALASIDRLATDAIEGLGSPDAEGSITAQTAELDDRLCDLLVDTGSTSPAPTASATPGTVPRPAGVPRDTVERLRAYLTDEPCSGIDRLLTPDGYPAPLADRLDEQRESWTTVAELVNTHGIALTAMRASLASAHAGVDAAAADSSADAAQLIALLAPVRAAATSLADQRDVLATGIRALESEQGRLATTIDEAFAAADQSASAAISAVLDDQVRRVSDRSSVDADSIAALFERSVAGLHSAADDIRRDGTATIDAEHGALGAAETAIGTAVSERTQDSLTTIATTLGASIRDTDAASALLAADLQRVLLDLGDRAVGGSGLLGAMTTSAAKVGTADVQLALASQSAQGYAAVRAEDVSGILLTQAQQRASLAAAAALPTFHLEVPGGSQTRTVFSFRIGDAR